MNFQDSTTQHLRDGVLQRRRQAAGKVAEAWRMLEDGKTTASKISELLAEAIKLIKPSDAPVPTRGRAVLATPTEEVLIFGSVDEAAGTMKVSPNSIWSAADRCGVSAGYFWRFVDELEAKARTKARQKGRAVYYIDERGKRSINFNSIADAVEKTGVLYYTINNSICGKRTTARGWRWFYVEARATAEAAA